MPRLCSVWLLGERAGPRQDSELLECFTFLLWFNFTTLNYFLAGREAGASGVGQDESL